jgi:C-terminal processing protease CtpA/Prc
METMKFQFAYIAVVALINIVSWRLCLASVLTNFQLDRLRIKADRKASHFGLVLNETVSFLQNHYIYRSIFSKTGWLQLRDEAAAKYPQNSHESVRYVLSKIQDPYCRLIDSAVMQGKSDNLRGVAVGLGLRLKRCWNLHCLSDMVNHVLFPSITKNRKLDFAINQGGYLCSAAVSMLSVLSKSAHAPSFRYVFFPLLFGSLLLRVTPFIRPFQVVEILNESAEQAGLQVGDKLVLVNGKPVPAVGTEEYVTGLLNRGPIGELVNVTVFRDIPISVGSSQSHINTNRAIAEHQLQVQRDYVLHETLEARLTNRVPGKSTAYIRIREFSDETFTEFAYVWDKLHKELQHPIVSLGSVRQNQPDSVELIAAANTKHNRFLFFSKFQFNIAKTQNKLDKIGGLIIDLRGNSGGALVPALDIASMFLPSGTVVTCLASNISPPTLVSSTDNNLKRPVILEKFVSTNRAADKDTAILVLTDERTASASEILVEALCDNNRAISAAPESRPAQYVGVVDDEYVPVKRTAADSKLAKSSPFSFVSYPGIKASAIVASDTNSPVKTVGKNLAQAVLSLSDGSGLFFSVREFFTPSGQSMGNGHHPRFALKSLGVSDNDYLSAWKQLFHRECATIDDLFFDAELDQWRITTNQ